MSDSMLDLVEERLTASLSLESAPAARQSSGTTKPSLPFTIIDMEKNNPVIHLYEIPIGRDVPGAVPNEGRSMFGAVTTKGNLIVYSTWFHTASWKREIGLEKVSWAEFAWRDLDNPTIMAHSRKSGFHLLKLTGSRETRAVQRCLDPRAGEIHIGFCKPATCFDFHVVVPTTNFKIGVYCNDEKEVINCHTFSTTVMAMKEMANYEFNKYMLCTTDDGSAHVLRIDRVSLSTKTGNAALLTKIHLPRYAETETSQPIGMCIEGLNNVFVIGTNLRYLFLFKWEKEHPKVLTPFGKKILPTDGVSSMAMMRGKSILAVGCFDGIVRLFMYPEMNQISTIHYHKTQINTMLFLNEKMSHGGRDYLLVGANDSGISVWTIPCCKEEDILSM